MFFETLQTLRLLERISDLAYNLRVKVRVSEG